MLGFLREVIDRKAGLFDKARTNDTRRAAIVALPDTGSPEALAFLRQLADGGDPQAREVQK